MNMRDVICALLFLLGIGAVIYAAAVLTGPTALATLAAGLMLMVILNGIAE
jgi:hypothetical protein